MTTTLPRGVAGSVLRRLTPEPERALPTDPVVWVRDELDEFLWSHQRNFMRSVIDHRYVAWKACHGPGKSRVASRLMAWWIEGHPRGEAIVVTAAPSGQQIRTILWRELNAAHAKGLPGRISMGAVPEWTIDGQLVAFGRKPQDLVDASQARAAFQGIHARYVLVLLDEAGGIPKWLWEAVNTLVTNEASRVVALGNPDDPTTHFAKICQPGSDWHVLKTSVFETPNFTGEQVPEQLRELLPSRTWVDERRREWGEDSPLYTSKVLGEFPDVADDVIITPRMVREAHERDLSGQAIGDRGRLGMDVARYGADETCIYLNRGGSIRLVDAWRKTDVDTSRARAENVILQDRYRPMQIDVVGLGAGVYDPLANKGYNVQPYGGGETANNPRRFANRNAEAWWAFREGLEQGLIDLDPDDLVLAAQLQARKWRLDAAQRRITIESKDDMRARGVPSPDRADAAILAWYEGVRTVGDMRALIAGAGSDGGSITGDLLSLRS